MRWSSRLTISSQNDSHDKQCDYGLEIAIFMSMFGSFQDDLCHCRLDIFPSFLFFTTLPFSGASSMPPAPSTALLRSLRRSLNGRSYVCATCAPKRTNARSTTTSASTSTPESQPAIPFRKQLKDEAKARKLNGDASSTQTTPNSSTIDPELLSRYELTVGLEIHAELSTTHKLFSPASTSAGLNTDAPNAHVSPFDAALPGAQPQFQRATLLPALRAALALGCMIQNHSTWDRKHYFWWDQPNGYQITQYYRPFAVDGSVTLSSADYAAQSSRPPEDIIVGIKQIQMEQDTAKTIQQPPYTHLLDMNRVSHPLVEIISLPHLHSPEAAAAYIKKVQGILKAVGACETGMEMGGLRCDVNVSVKAREVTENAGAVHSYAGIHNLAQRTEIKNLSSIAAVAAAITAERNRQILVLEDGGRIEGETRGWTLGATSTHRLRGKEGEVDYRYLPDVDLPPLVIGDDLIKYLRETLPELPEALIKRLVEEFGITAKDAATMVELDDGERVDYYFDVVQKMQGMHDFGTQTQQLTRIASNWVLHELGALLTTSQRHFDPSIVTADQLTAILVLLRTDQITLPTAKSLLSIAFEGRLGESVHEHVDEHGLRLEPMSDADYSRLAEEILQLDSTMAAKARQEAVKAAASADDGGADSDAASTKKKKSKPGGKMMWFVGQMVRKGQDGRVQPERAEKALRAVLLSKNQGP